MMRTWGVTFPAWGQGARSDFMESTSPRLRFPFPKFKNLWNKTCKKPLMIPKRSLLKCYCKQCLVKILRVQHLAQFQQKSRWQQNSRLTVFRLFGLCGDVGDDAAQQGRWKGIQDLSLAMLERHPWQTSQSIDTAHHLAHPVTIALHFPVPLSWASQD